MKLRGQFLSGTGLCVILVATLAGAEETVKCIVSQVSIDAGDCSGNFSLKVCATDQQHADSQAFEYAALFGEDFSSEHCDWVGGFCGAVGGVPGERMTSCDCKEAFRLFSNQCTSDETCDVAQVEPRVCCSRDEQWLRTECDSVDETALAALIDDQRKTTACFDVRCVEYESHDGEDASTTGLDTGVESVGQDSLPGEGPIMCLQSSASIPTGDCTGNYSFKVCARSQAQADAKVKEYVMLFGEEFSEAQCSWVG
eukprot:CAMPEP_0181330108 /NCGR_PEP_ID=MMETSP1101-20121128/23705_1 /TAXON_ID=46948 /ORGANISM="Rhodomonas abbreviata, Strain Caron Lab Isolate" /LENGTH=254 /DNA_ID=CAMNT_0023439305 /DNA_START=22 /DNA_END=782 /DNA_ORIENTATION=-